ncbi:MAG: hypothetical protein JWM99_2707 [Verrucomicrobiales bacterium]|nr:hypothetical protein [Verrucomicrobiales bacterium]
MQHRRSAPSQVECFEDPPKNPFPREENPGPNDGWQRRAPYIRIFRRNQKTPKGFQNKAQRLFRAPSEITLGKPSTPKKII